MKFYFQNPIYHFLEDIHHVAGDKNSDSTT